MENIELKGRFIDEKTGIEYIRNGDYYLPNLVLTEQKKIQLNKYGRLRLDYLKNHKKAEYTILFMDNKLTEHLEEVQEITTKRVDEIIKSLKEQIQETELVCYLSSDNFSKDKIKQIVEFIIIKRKISRS